MLCNVRFMGMALWWNYFGTHVPFSDSPLGLTFPSEQFWGRAARASWLRKNPDARLIFRKTPHRWWCRFLRRDAACSGVARTLLSASADRFQSTRAARAKKYFD